MRLVLLHSPLVGPGTWRLLKPAVEARGHEVIVPDYALLMRSAGPYYEKIARVIAEVAKPSTEPVTFVAHSGAGALVPIVAAAHRDAGAIFMDALLPHPSKSWFTTAPEALNARIHALATNGHVPPWHEWWPKGAIENLLGADLFAAFEFEAHDMPLAYFEEIAPDVPNLPAERCAFLQLSAAYSEADTADQNGWPTRRLPLNHFAMLTHPQEVATAVHEMAIALAKN